MAQLLDFFTFKPEQTPAEPEPLDKKTAERMLGFKNGDYYGYHDLAEHHNTIREKKVKNGAKAAELARVDEAFALLAQGVANNSSIQTAECENTVVIDDDKKTYSFTEAAVESVSMWSEGFRAPDIRQMHIEAHDEAALRAGQSVDISYPAPHRTQPLPVWWRVMNWITVHFPWRLVFLLVVGYFGFESINRPMNSIEDGLAIAFESVILLIVLAANTFGGIITNPIRYLIRRGIDSSLAHSFLVHEKQALSTALANGTATNVMPGTYAAETAETTEITPAS